MNIRLYSQFLLFFSATAVFILYNIDAMWSGSVDLAHHYALAYRISEHWTLLPHSDPTLGEMSIYPRGSHIIAAIIGTLVNSTFLGMQVTTLLSISLLWVSIFFILKSFPRPIGTAALAVAIGLFLLNHFSFRFQIHGYEVVGSFFYSQLVGQAFLFFCLIYALGVDKKYGALWAVTALVPLMCFLATIHLLPAIEVLGLIFALVVTFVFSEYWNGRARFRTFTLSSLLLLIAISCIIFHPSFSAMMALSKNNGGLNLSNITYPVGLFTLCFLVFSTSIFLIVQWWRKTNDKGFLAAKYLALYGLATVGICFLQYVLTYFGKGSDYAVKKYVFGLLTIFFLQLSVILSMAIVSFKRARVLLAKLDGAFLYFAPLFALSIIVLFLFKPRTKAIDVSNIVSIESRLAYLFSISTHLIDNAKPSVVIGLKRFPNAINYMFSISIAKTPRNLAIPDVLVENNLSNPRLYSYVVSSSTNKEYGPNNCKSFSSGDISIIESQCLSDRLENAKNCSHPFNFKLTGGVSKSLLEGFSNPEPHGRWTDGTTASFKCSSNETVYKKVLLEIAPFKYGPLRSQHLQLTVNGKSVYQGSLSVARGPSNPLVIDLTGVPFSEIYTITFSIPDAVSPKEVGLNEDQRKLGFSLRKISFQ